MVFLVIIGLIMAILAILFAFQNAAVVAISFGIWKFEQSLAIILIVTLGLGIIISLLLSLPTILKRGWQNAKYKKKIVDLEAQLESQNKTNSQQQQQTIAQQDAIQELLQAFDLSDTVTGLLTKDATVNMTSHLLKQIQNQPSNPKYSSLVTMLFKVEPGKSQLNFADVGSENAVYKAIDNRFRNATIPDSFLGITERKRFISLAVGLRGTEIIEYATYLQDKIMASPLQKADGSVLPLKVSVGGVIVDPTDKIDSRSILKQAEQNLEVSLNTSRHTPEITEVTVKTL
ncbi:MAG: lipopolysaccharide assembly LapA domain-containing protein [Pleurocapsa sp.]